MAGKNKLHWTRGAGGTENPDGSLAVLELNGRPLVENE